MLGIGFHSDVQFWRLFQGQVAQQRAATKPPTDVGFELTRPDLNPQVQTALELAKIRSQDDVMMRFGYGTSAQCRSRWECVLNVWRALRFSIVSSVPTSTAGIAARPVIQQGSGE